MGETTHSIVLKFNEKMEGQHFSFGCHNVSNGMGWFRRVEFLLLPLCK